MTAATTPRRSMFSFTLSSAFYLIRQGVRLCRSHFDNNPFAWGCFFGLATISTPIFTFLLFWGFAGIVAKHLLKRLGL